MVSVIPILITYLLFRQDRYHLTNGPLQSETFHTMIDTLRKYFDYVIVDTAPIGMVIDAVSLHKNVMLLSWLRQLERQNDVIS